MNTFFQFVYNNIKHNITELTLTKILFKIQLQLCINVNMNNKYLKMKKIINYVTFLQDVCAQLTKYLQKTHEMQKKYYNKMHISMKFNIRNRVFIKI